MLRIHIQAIPAIHKRLDEDYNFWLALSNIYILNDDYRIALLQYRKTSFEKMRTEIGKYYNIFKFIFTVKELVNIIINGEDAIERLVCLEKNKDLLERMGEKGIRIVTSIFASSYSNIEKMKWFDGLLKKFTQTLSLSSSSSSVTTSTRSSLSQLSTSTFLPPSSNSSTDKQSSASLQQAPLGRAMMPTATSVPLYGSGSAVRQQQDFALSSTTRTSGNPFTMFGSSSSSSRQHPEKRSRETVLGVELDTRRKQPRTSIDLTTDTSLQQSSSGLSSLTSNASSTSFFGQNFVDLDPLPSNFSDSDIQDVGESDQTRLSLSPLAGSSKDR